ncbi:undecaprenyl-diphosphate phosphatase [Tepidicaulis sp. LMO-SS28]|uniref:undecaprenyl-diphosphate phosphatase n=1 Tax=Tepidicaulis sp. LMO-SS28 TaxID=3447455 RepID=UPI003EDFB81B
MTPFELIVLAIVQGITEFLPISSSGHLILVPALTGWSDQGLALDVAVHVGSLAAVVVYFWADARAMLAGSVRFVQGKRDQDTRLTGLVLLATLPTVAAGLALHLYADEALRSITVIAWTTIGFGILLGLADWFCRRELTVENVTARHALIIGFAQVLALVPGTSRSGITMTAARALGYERTEAARFSMLMAMPVTAAAGALIILEIWQSRNYALQLDAVMAALFAFFAAWASLAAMMAWLRKFSMTPFVIYRLALGIGLLIWAHG